MCGIAGIAGSGGVPEGSHALVHGMLKQIAHRGPDDEHVVTTSGAVLGARRLAILDLDGGRQPLTGDNPSITVSNNGEVYNYVELRRELVTLGHSFRTKGDTEVVAHAYEEWGLDFVLRLRGMFAIALWDDTTKRLVLARDRIGKKPLYWRFAHGNLLWGSELKAILADPAVPRDIDREAIDLYLRYQYVPAPRSILASIQKLEPGSMLVWDWGAASPHVHRYWTPEYVPKLDGTFSSHVERLDSLLRESVNLRLRSDVPIGVFLSGGVDSGLITALAVRSLGRGLRTYSIGFDDASLDELLAARSVARSFETEHTEDVVSLDALEMLPSLVEEFDEPFADSSALPTFRVAQLASRDVKVVLTGDGGDENFGGYRRYTAATAIGAIGALPTGIRRAGRLVTQAIVATRLGRDPRVRRLERGWAIAEAPAEQSYLGFVSIFDRDTILRLTGGDGTDNYLASAMDARLGPVDGMLRADLLTYLPEDLLVKMDRATMANSLEARSPLLDQEVVMLAARLPASEKIRGRDGKVILRRVAERYLPRHHVWRGKMGFAVPIDRWFDDRLGDVLLDVLRSKQGTGQLVDPSVGLGLLDEHRRNIRRHGHRLWALLMLEMWAKRWSKRELAVAA